MKSVYIETTIPSYLVSKPSRDVVMLANQQITKEWWENERKKFELFISESVLDEIMQGNKELAAKRLESIQGIKELALDVSILKLAREFQRVLSLPEKVFRDAIHLACTSAFNIDFLLTWNCKHLANADLVFMLNKIYSNTSVHIPVICTPSQLLNTSEGGSYGVE